MSWMPKCAGCTLEPTARKLRPASEICCRVMAGTARPITRCTRRAKRPGGPFASKTVCRVGLIREGTAHADLPRNRVRYAGGPDCPDVASVYDAKRLPRRDSVRLRQRDLLILE